MKPFFLLVMTAALAFAGGSVFSSTDAPSDPHAEPRVVAEKLAACIADDKLDDLKTAAWECCIDEQVVASLGDQLDLPYKRMCEGLGARTKVELLKAEAAGPSIVRFHYAEFHTRGVLVWQFEFIKPADTWKLHAYGWGPLRMEGVEPSALMSPIGG